jgi:1-phosphatidylinositol-3-phosphate 5-kinase
MTSVASSHSDMASRVGAGPSSRLSRDDPTSLTSFNPFQDADEQDQSSYTLVTALFSRVKNSIAAATTSPATAVNAGPTQPVPITTASNLPPQPPVEQSKRPALTPHHLSYASSSSSSFRPTTKPAVAASHGQGMKLSSRPAQPLVSLTPAISEAPSVDREERVFDRPPSRADSIPIFYDASPDIHGYNTSIPGFQLPDDARSIRTTAMSVRRSDSVSKVIRRIRGEGTYIISSSRCAEN